jgi:hypothetical protein
VKQTLRDIAKIVRSKNSGPFEVTLDVVFDDESIYQKVKSSGVLNAQMIATLYRLSPDKVLNCEFFDPALAFKATIARSVSSGSPAETDTYGGQQSAPLLAVSFEI